MFSDRGSNISVLRSEVTIEAAGLAHADKLLTNYETFLRGQYEGGGTDAKEIFLLDRTLRDSADKDYVGAVEFHALHSRFLDFQLVEEPIQRRYH